MRRMMALATAFALAACSQETPDPTRLSRDTPTRIGAAAIVRAYGQDADEADLAFVGHPLLIEGDVVRVDQDGRRLILTTGASTERLPAAIALSPKPIAPHDLISLRCDRIERVGSKPRVSSCAITAIIPARIAHGD